MFSQNAGKYGPEKTPYLDTFHAVEAGKKFHEALMSKFKLPLELIK